MTDRVGERFGNYQLVRLLGQGGFAEVYLGKHIHLASLVAIKILRSQLAQHEQEKFLQEARLIASLDHPSIVRILDCGIERDTPYLIMNYAPHGTLRQRYPKGVQLPLAHVLLYSGQVASALQYAHELRVIHRDIKPENMLSGSQGEVLLSDFGIALISSSSSSQSTKAAAGTMPYMAPEQIMGKPRLASDQYALGVVIYEWLCGERPFSGSFVELCAQHLYASPPSILTKNHQIPSEVEAVVMKSLSKEPQNRFANVRDFINALEQAAQPSLSGFISSTLPPSPRKDTRTVRDSMDASTFVKAPAEDGTTLRTPNADSKAIQSQSDISTFVKLLPETSTQQNIRESLIQDTDVLASEQKSQTFSRMNTLSADIPAHPSGKANTTNQGTGPVERLTQPKKTTRTRTKQRRIQSWLFITLAVLIVFTLITGSLVLAQMAAHLSTNNARATTPVPTTTPVGISSQISPTVTLKHTPMPDPTASADHSPTPTVTPDPSPTSVPPTLTTTPSNLLVTDPSKYCTIDTHGGSATAMTCSIVLSNTSKTSSTLNWSASMIPADYTISPASGSIAPGKSATITFYNYSSVACPATETLFIKGSANTVQIPILCTYLFDNPDGYSFNSSYCTHNGNWTCIITISATRDTVSIPWQITAASSAGVTLSQASGTLAPGGSVQITITIASTDCPGSNSFTISGGSLINPAADYLNWSC